MFNVSDTCDFKSNLAHRYTISIRGFKFGIENQTELGPKRRRKKKEEKDSHTALPHKRRLKSTFQIGGYIAFTPRGM